MYLPVIAVFFHLALLENHRLNSGVSFALLPPQVVSIKPSSPASDSGRIQIGDILISVDGYPVSRVPFGKVAARLIGPSGSIATLQLERNGFPFSVRYNVQLTRRFIGPGPNDAPHPREAAAPAPISRVSPREVPSMSHVRASPRGASPKGVSRAPVRMSPRPIETWGSSWGSAAQSRGQTPPMMAQGVAHNHSNAGPQPVPPRSPRPPQKMPMVLSVGQPFVAKQPAPPRSPRPSMMIAAPTFGYTPRAAVSPWGDMGMGVNGGGSGGGTIYQTLFGPGTGSAAPSFPVQPVYQTRNW